MANNVNTITDLEVNTQEIDEAVINEMYSSWAEEQANKYDCADAVLHHFT